MNSYVLYQNNFSFDSSPPFVQSGLHYYQKYLTVRQQPFYQKVIVAEALKNQGNLAFSYGSILDAIDYYEQALSIFAFVTNSSDIKTEVLDENLKYYYLKPQSQKETNVLNDFKLKIYLNLALCYQKKDRFKDSIISCDEALKIDKENLKALYRRAKSRILKCNKEQGEEFNQEYEQAYEDLDRAIMLSPLDMEIRKEKETLEQKYNLSRKIKIQIKTISKQEKEQVLLNMKSKCANEQNNQPLSPSDQQE